MSKWLISECHILIPFKLHIFSMNDLTTEYISLSFFFFFFSCWLFLLGFFLLINLSWHWFLVNEWMEKGGQWWRQNKIVWREKYTHTACRSPQHLSRISWCHWMMIYEDCRWSVMMHSWVKWKKNKVITFPKAKYIQFKELPFILRL